MRRRKFRRGRNPCLPAACAAFGLGLVLALFGSFKLALIVAAAALIFLSTCSRPC